MKYQQLNNEDAKLKTYQEQTLLKNWFDALVQHKKDSVWERSANKAADEERSFWLAKKAFEGWVDQLDKFKQKNNLYKLLDSHYHYSLKKKAVSQLKLYTDFKLEQRYSDLIIVNEIVQIRQRNILQNWKRVQIKRQAVKKLTYLSETAIKAVMFIE